MNKRIVQVIHPHLPVLPVKGTVRVWVPCQVYREPADPNCVSIFVGEGRSRTTINFLDPVLVRTEKEIPEVSMGSVMGEIQADLVAWDMSNGNFLVTVPANLTVESQKQAWISGKELPELEVDITYPTWADISYFSSTL